MLTSHGNELFTEVTTDTAAHTGQVSRFGWESAVFYPLFGRVTVLVISCFTVVNTAVVSLLPPRSYGSLTVVFFAPPTLTSPLFSSPKLDRYDR